jgi:hypothetical protein
MRDKIIMTDLELVYKWCEECINFPNPLLLRDIEARGLYNIINYLPDDVEEAKAVAYARMLKAGKAFGDDEIDYIADRITTLEGMRVKLNETPITDSHKIAKYLDFMVVLNNEIKDYFKK